MESGARHSLTRSDSATANDTDLSDARSDHSGELSPLSKGIAAARSQRRQKVAEAQRASQQSGDSTHRPARRISRIAAGGHIGDISADEYGEQTVELDLGRDPDTEHVVDPEETQSTWWLDRLVLPETNSTRNMWSLVLALLLVYTATVMPYTLCFLDFRLKGGSEISDGLYSVRMLVDALFWVDLIANFFFSYIDSEGKEIMVMRKIACNYLSGYFFLNLIACIPDAAFEAMTGASGAGSDNSNASSLTRLSRVQRLGRLGRLLRLVRLVKVFAFMKERSWFLWLQRLRGVRMLNLWVSLLWVNHLVACGWYLCAALHEDPDHTWVWRRILPDGERLITKGPADQWIAAMYFVMSVFMTIGFGDIIALTQGEILYAGFTMLIGAVSQGTVMSEVINVMTEMDDKALEYSQQKTLVKAFVEHTELDNDMSIALTRWLDPSVKSRSRSCQYDRKAMKKILASGAMPDMLMEQMQHIVFGGTLIRNKFVKMCTQSSPSGRLPPRFPLILSLAMMRHDYQKGEIVFQLHDHPCNMFLVMKGVFACVGLPSALGGIDTLLTVDTLRRHESQAFDRVNSMVSNAASARQRARGGRLFVLKSASSAFHPGNRRELVMDINAIPNTEDAYPYQLYPFGSFFGEYEMVGAPKTASGGYQARNCSVRCEADNASILVISTHDLVQMMADFPHFVGAWHAAARLNERRRLAAKAAHTCGITYRQLGACKIQAFWRYQRRPFGDATKMASERAKERREFTAEVMKQGYDWMERHGNDDAEAEAYSKTIGNTRQPADMLLERMPADEDVTALREEVKNLRSELKSIQQSMSQVPALKHSFNELKAVMSDGSNNLGSREDLGNKIRWI